MKINRESRIGAIDSNRRDAPLKEYISFYLADTIFFFGLTCRCTRRRRRRRPGTASGRVPRRKWSPSRFRHPRSATSSHWRCSGSAVVIGILPADRCHPSSPRLTFAPDRPPRAESLIRARAERSMLSRQPQTRVYLAATRDDACRAHGIVATSIASQKCAARSEMLREKGHKLFISFLFPRHKTYLRLFAKRFSGFTKLSHSILYI